MSILLKCSSRKHTLRLNPNRFWKKTLCPQCKVPVDPIRLRRISKLPALFFARDFEVIPAFVTRKLIPVLGLIALIVGLSLTFVNWPKGNATMSANTSTPPSTESKSNGMLASVPSNSVSEPSNNANLTASVLPANSQAATIPTNTSTNATYQETANVAVSSTPIPPTVRYSTGTNLIRPSSVGGHGSLKISNGTSSDAVAKLVDIATNKTCRLVFIQSSTVDTINNISSGNYTLKFSLGSDYDKESGKFLYGQSFSKFDEILDFSVSRTAGGIQWMDYEVTLNPVLGGTARTSSISAADFEDH